MTNPRAYFKFLFIIPLLLLAACSTNQATGRNQFTGLMPASQEASIGAQEHKKVLAEFGGEVEDQQLKDYVTSVGQKIVPHTERSDVTYTFTVLDSPIINAFALPGGYVYVTRGIMALANNEAELAAVIAHEIGHVTARHSAERYSRSVLTNLGAGILAAAINIDSASQALGLGANLYLTSYSREQEHEADDLSIRYLSRAGYDTLAMADLLESLDASTRLQLKEAGRDENDLGPTYLSTHPVTKERIARSAALAATTPPNKEISNRLEYLRMINGLIMGDSPKQGFVDEGVFVHPELGFRFKVPQDYKTQNTSRAFIAQKDGPGTPTVIFTAEKKQAGQSIQEYLRLNVLKGNLSDTRDFGTNKINGLNTASVEKATTIGGEKVNMRIVALEWDQDTVYQFMIVLPLNTPESEILTIRDSVESFKRLTNTEKLAFSPKTIEIRVAKPNDTIESLTKNFPYEDAFNIDRFRVLNGMKDTDLLHPQSAYKVITQ